MPELPEGWIPMQLGDTGSWLSGGTPATNEPRFWHGDIPWISAASLKGFRLRDSDRRITKSGSLAGTRLIPRDAILFVVRGMSLKSELRVGVAEREMAFGQDCKAIIPKEGIDGSFLALAMKARSREILSMVDEAGHGTGRLPTDLVYRLSIGVPKFREQRYIVEIFDALDDRIREVERVLAKQQSISSAVAQRLVPVRPDPSVVGPGWRLAPLSTIVPSVDYGISTPLVTGEDGIPVLRMGNLVSGRVSVDDIKVSTSPVPESLILRDNDVLFNRTNSFAHVGRAAMWRGELERATFASYLVRLNPDLRQLVPGYIVRWLNQPAIQQRIRRSATPGVHQVNINPTSLRNTPVEFLADIAGQQEIVARLDECDRVTEGMKIELQRLCKIRQGVLDDLLTGRVRVPVGI